MSEREILFATDYSEASQAALPLATCMARVSGAKLVIAHVSLREQYPVGELFDEEPPPGDHELEELEAVVPADPQVKYEHRLLHGEPGSTETVKPADAIVKLAEEENVEAIVIGMHGRWSLARMLMGTVAESVVRRAPCPVVTIKSFSKTAS